MSFPESIRNIYQAQLADIQHAGIFKEERFIHSAQSADIEVEFPSGSELKKVINMCANNYLGLSSHPDVVKAAHEGLETRGYGMSSVRFICGTQDIHRELENRVTEFLGTEDTILFPSCMDANAGVFEAILTSEDVMISDRLVHASIIDGMRLCSAQHDTFKHSSMEHLEEKLLLHADKRLKLVITDGVFSMDGDTAKLDQMVDLCDKYGAMLRIRSALAHGIPDYFAKEGFALVHTPVITGSDCEGAGEMFRVTTLGPEAAALPPAERVSQDFFGKEAMLTVSGQLSAEPLACALGRVYTFGPTFRAEHSDTSRHAAEFWMLEPEMAFADLEDNMDLAESLVTHLVRLVLAECAEDFGLFAKFVDPTLPAF